ncbi:MAG TPA: hypothetical protein VGE31_00520 [Candidatus Paceibacterota bacterium]
MRKARALVIACVIIISSGLAGAALEISAHGSDIYTIEITNEGYNPVDLTILQGDTVVFKNSDTVPHWPASNIHPTHQIYSDFDPMKGVPPGESWSFTFTKAGDWRWHDHIYPEQVGTINVQRDPDFVEPEPPEAAVEAFTWWESLKIKVLKIYYRYFEDRAATKLGELDIFEVSQNEKELRTWLIIFGAETMMEDLLADAGGGTVMDCHQPAHILGRLAYEIYGAEAFEKGNASCHSGFYHGAMEAFLAVKGTEHLAADIGKLCALFKTQFGKFECLHGVGHGVMAYEDYDLPRALEVCTQLGDDYSVSSCYGGVFMENVVVGLGLGAVEGHSTSWLSEDPHFPCNTLSDYSQLYQCYQMQTSWMLSLTEYNFETVANECQRASETMIPVCYKSLGRDAAGHTLRDPEQTVTYCNLVKNGEHYNECITGAVNVVIDFWGAGLTDQASEFCAAVPVSSQSYCYDLVGDRVDDLFTDAAEKEGVCSSFPEEYKALCNAG